MSHWWWLFGISLSILVMIVVLINYNSARTSKTDVSRNTPTEAQASLDWLDVRIVYSYTLHENPQVFLDTLSNLFYYNSGDIFVIVHCSPDITAELQQLLDSNPKLSVRVRLHPAPTYKRAFSSDIYAAHIRNAEWCMQRRLNPEWFITLASNCYFHQFVTRDYLSGVNSNIFTSVGTESNTNWHWPTFFHHTLLVDAIKSAGILEFVQGQHEGRIIPWSTMIQIVNFDLKHNLSGFDCLNAAAEEILLPTLIRFFQGEDVPILCKLFETYPTVEDVQRTSDFPCVKRVNRVIDAPVRVWQRDLTKNYTREQDFQKLS
jgi:hypothetical protein